ncbi:hypothetical protein [Subtercola sp. YIM 133946]|uniref:hypothetical protein n=1 Tax=Subtercola sp. YIM 133946 TaxID=3118909 RepID=UPI002F95BC02
MQHALHPSTRGTPRPVATPGPSGEAASSGAADDAEVPVDSAGRGAVHSVAAHDGIHPGGGAFTAAAHDDIDPREAAYSVPLRVDRSGAPRYRIVNVGHERLVGLTFSLLGSGVMTSAVPRTLDVGEGAEVVIRGDDLARRTVLVVRWFRPSGEEYLWRVSF